MYVNKCIKCGAEFETKNPKRVICPNCLYAEKGSTTATSSTGDDAQPLQSYSSYSTEDRPQRRFDNRNNQRPRNNYGNNNRGRYDNNRPQGGGYNQGGGYGGQRRFDNNRPQGGGFNRPQQNRRPQNNRFQQNKRPMRPQKRATKPLLVSKEQLEQIELMYKSMLPLPNPDAHEVIAEKLEIESRKVFFGINLVRQKLMLPKLPFPKRKLAVSPDQMLAVKSLYEPLLPLPPIGCHKIIAAQLRIDEWRVHVAIKLIRAQLGLDRWNEERTDKPADYLVPKYPNNSKKKEEKTPEAEVKPESEVVEEEPKKRATRKKKDEEVAEAPVAEAEATEETPKKRTTRKKEDEEEVATTESDVVEEKPKRGRKPKKKEDE